MKSRFPSLIAITVSAIAAFSTLAAGPTLAKAQTVAASADKPGDKLKEFKVANLLGAHCTGTEAVCHLRERIGLTRKSAVVGSVGSTFTLAEGIHPGVLAK